MRHREHGRDTLAEFVRNRVGEMALFVVPCAVFVGGPHFGRLRQPVAVPDVRQPAVVERGAIV